MNEDFHYQARCETCERIGLECPSGYDLESWRCARCGTRMTIAVAFCLLEDGADTTPPCDCGQSMTREPIPEPTT